jgi:hypothetical protein
MTVRDRRLNRFLKLSLLEKMQLISIIYWRIKTRYWSLLHNLPFGLDWSDFQHLRTT